MRGFDCYLSTAVAVEADCSKTRKITEAGPLVVRTDRNLREALVLS
jgi:hypothetical protein